MNKIGHSTVDDIYLDSVSVRQRLTAYQNSDEQYAEACAVRRAH